MMSSYENNKSKGADGNVIALTSSPHESNQLQLNSQTSSLRNSKNMYQHHDRKQQNFMSFQNSDHLGAGGSNDEAYLL